MRNNNITTRIADKKKERKKQQNIILNWDQRSYDVNSTMKWNQIMLKEHATFITCRWFALT